MVLGRGRRVTHQEFWYKNERADDLAYLEKGTHIIHSQVTKKKLNEKHPNVYFIQYP